MEKKHISQKRAAELLGISNSRLNAFETGRSRRMKEEVMERLLRLLAKWCVEDGYYPWAKMSSALDNNETWEIQKTSEPATESLKIAILSMCKTRDEKVRMESIVSSYDLPALTDLFMTLKHSCAAN